MGMGKEVFQTVDSDFIISKENRQAVKRAEKDRQVIHISKLIGREPSRKDAEREQHLMERKARKKWRSSKNKLPLTIKR